MPGHAGEHSQHAAKSEEEIYQVAKAKQSTTSTPPGKIQFKSY
jgi:hypothetical protein